MSELPPPTPESPSATTPFVPRWYNVSLIVLALAAAISLLYRNQPFFAAIFFVGIAIATVIEFWWRPRARRRGRSDAGYASHGTYCVSGAIYVVVGVSYFFVTSEAWLGVFMLMLGALTLFAFGPGYLRTRRAR